MTSGKRLRRARSASVNSWTGITTSMGKETFVTLHAYRGEKNTICSTDHVDFWPAQTFSSTQGGSDADAGLSPSLERYPGCDPPAPGHFGIRPARTACGG